MVTRNTVAKYGRFWGAHLKLNLPYNLWYTQLQHGKLNVGTLDLCQSLPTLKLGFTCFFCLSPSVSKPNLKHARYLNGCSELAGHLIFHLIGPRYICQRGKFVLEKLRNRTFSTKLGITYSVKSGNIQFIVCSGIKCQFVSKKKLIIIHYLTNVTWQNKLVKVHF